MIYTSVLALIGNTPLVELTSTWPGPGKLLAKMEHLQPGGSIKDRAALHIIKDAKADGRLRKGQAVFEMTSGNMGAGLAVVCSYFRHPFTAVMPEGNSPERIKILKALGADVVIVPQVSGEKGRVTGEDIAAATEEAKKLAKKTRGFYVDQFNNDSGVNAHYRTTGPEIWNQTRKKVSAFVAAVGSSGSFTGTSKYLKKENPLIKCMAVEPEKAAILKTGKVEDARHIIQGTGYSLIPPHWDATLADDIILVSDEEANHYKKQLSEKEGLFAGFSAGANVAASIKYLENSNNADEMVVTFLCDSGFKY